MLLCVSPRILAQLPSTVTRAEALPKPATGRLLTPEPLKVLMVATIAGQQRDDTLLLPEAFAPHLNRFVASASASQEPFRFSGNERRIEVQSSRLTTTSRGSVLLIGITRSGALLTRLLRPDGNPHGRAVTVIAGDVGQVPREYYLLDTNPEEPAERHAIRSFLPKFDAIAQQGFVPSLRRGSTGIGFTLETMLGIKENNRSTGDFLGMELKAYRTDVADSHDEERMNLFLKEPRWMERMPTAKRVEKYGYVDSNGRTAMYSTVRSKVNSHKLRLRIDEEHRRLFLQFDDRDVAWWSYETLKRRLQEKLNETAFVGATSRKEKAIESFRYHTVTWCAVPSVEGLLRLIKTGDVMLELRMHVQPGGQVRNHGSAFRIRKRRLPELYAKVGRLRSSADYTIRED